jgi:hypothetical protein
LGPILFVMRTDTKHCSHCHGRLIEIDYYGQRMIGCIECNRWGWPHDERLLMEMPDDDLEALGGASDEINERDE